MHDVVKYFHNIQVLKNTLRPISKIISKALIFVLYVETSLNITSIATAYAMWISPYRPYCSCCRYKILPLETAWWIVENNQIFAFL